MQNPFRDFNYWSFVTVVVSILVIGYVLGKILI